MKKIMTTRNTALEPNDDLTRANGRFGSSQVFLGLKAMFMAAMLLMSVVAMAQQQPTGVVVKGHVFGGGNEGPVLSDAEVSIAAGTVEKDVYGGGNLADVSGSVTVTMTGGTVNKDVYGGGALANTNIGNVTSGYGTDNETISSTSTKTTTVNLQGGTIKGDAYGGGLGRIGVKGKEAVEADPEHGIEAQDAVPAIEEVKAKVYGDVHVYLGVDENGVAPSATKFNITNYTGDHSDVVKSGRIFGCNNLNGSPQGDVTVTVWKTEAGNKTRTDEKKLKLKEGDEGYVAHTYEVAAVYGGGNLADYTAAGKTTNVRIKTCDVSIENVYGGGNAAKVPRTDVLVQGAYEIKEVFGGGNGKDPYTLNGGTDWIDNAGADVGSEGTSGGTNTLLTGGYVHEAYGGSNKKGTVYGSVFIDMSVGTVALGTIGACNLEVEKLVGAGKDADVNGDLIMVMGCKPNTFTPIVYGGADNANVNGNVELTITSGKFGKVFGGNNQGGYILGHIKLNIEETGDCDVPIEIDELYLGGNEAAYSMYGYYNAGTDQNPDYRPRSLEMTDSENANYQQAISTISGSTVRHEAPYDQPELNVISCTRIGRVFGGGYGSGAALYGNPIVNINMIPGSHSVDITREGVDAAHRLGEIGGKYTNAENKIVDGGVFGGGDGAAVYGNTTVNIGTATTVNLTSIPDDSSTSNIDESLKTVEGAYIVGNVYGGGNEADVTGNTLVNICAINSDDPATTDVVEYTGVTISGTNFEGVTIKGNVYGGGKGKADNFTCDKAMVGVNNEGEGIPNPGSGENKEKGTKVIIGNGTVEKNVYGGGEVGRVEWNTVVTIGVGEGVDPTSATPTSAPEIKGSVFGAGSGVATHGYSALVRGDCTVTIEGNAKVKGSVYGGGEIATAGRYWVKGITPGKLGKDKEGNDEVVPTYPNELATGLPYKQRSGGICTVTIRGRAEIGPETPSAVAGNVFGGGKGVEPDYHADGEYQSQRWVKDVGLQGFANEAAYLEFLQTLALVTNTFVNIDGENIRVKGSVYGGSENGFVSTHTDVKIKNGFIGTEGTTTFGNVYGGGKGIETFAEAGKVSENTAVAIIGATTYGSVYGGGELGNVKGNTKIEMNGGTVAKNIYGGGKGKDDTFTCEKGMVGVDGDGEGIPNPGSDENYKEKGTKVIIRNGTVNGSVYGGGEVGRVEWNTQVEIGVGTGEGSFAPEIKGSVFGAGKGAATHGYSALVRGDCTVTIDGGAKVKGSVYGGGEIATAGRYWVNGITPGKLGNDEEGNDEVVPTPPTGLAIGLPYKQRSGGICTVTIKGSAEIGPGTPTADAGNVFGAGKGVEPDYHADGESQSQRWVKDVGLQAFDNEAAYLEFLQTLALVTNTKVTIDGAEAKVKGSVYGGSENGFVQTHTDVKILSGVIGTEGTTAYGNVYGGGKGFPGFAEAGKVSGYTKVAIGGTTIHGSVYGGGELGYVKQDVTVDITAGEVKKDVYGGGALANTNTDNWDATAGDWATGMVGADGKTTYKTLVNLSGGTVKRDIYGGGLGQLGDSPIEAKVYGDVTVTTTGGKAERVFGCNNLNGAPQGIVTVNINDTEHISTASGDYAIGNVYGGGNQAAYSYNDADHPLTVTMAGGTVNNVFGGGLSADVLGSIAVNVTGGLVLNDVYGGGALANTNTGNVTDYGTNSATISSTSTYTTTVNLTGGTIGNAYGGGLGELGTGEHYTAEDDEVINGTKTVDDWKIHPSVGEGSIKAIVYGDVTVTVNEYNDNTQEFGGTARFTIASENKTYNKKVRNSQNVEETVETTGLVYSKGRVFGCNNVNGTPKGDVTVTVWRTLPQVSTQHIYTEDGGSYEIQAVYGGGNMADYEPADTKKPTVNIHGCGETSIQYVFGGGNAASVPETHVNIYGTFEIEAVFGGGNGNEPIFSEGVWVQSPGAEILGNTNVRLMAGLMHQAFGGSFEKGIIRGTTNLVKNKEGGEGCVLKITDVFGGGKDADVQEVNIVLSECTMDQIQDVQAGDVTQQIENVYAGSYNARILGNVTMTIQSGTFKNVFGGNYSGGFINGQITLNVEETSRCKPVKITNLYGGGNYAPYPGAGANNSNPKITINVKACTSIGNIYGGSYHADVNGNTEVNINMIKGWWAGKRYPTNSTDSKDDIPNAIGTIGNVFGGGDQGDVIGNTVVNIGTLTEIDLVTIPEGDPNDGDPIPSQFTKNGNKKYDVLGAKITGNVYGGGNQADVTGITNVNICAKYDENEKEWQSVATGASGVTISGSVYGGGKGKADNFECDKAMVGRNNHGVDDDEGNTYVHIGNGMVGTLDGQGKLVEGTGNVYGGGEIGRVESHTNVMIGIGEGHPTTPTSVPVIMGSVFGAGQGVATHGYSGLVRGNSTVVIQGNAEVGQSVYGGGQKATVGRFWVKNVNDDTYEHKNDYPDVPTGMPYALMSGGVCSVTIQGYAKIGPDNMVMPTFSGHVFGAGKGLTPYLDTDTESGSGEGQGPGRWYAPGGTYTWQSYAENETKYLEYLQTLALADETDVIITGHAFIKGSVYGGSENGRVLDDTNVKIQEHCQIGNGWNKTTNSGVNSLYTEDEWTNDVTSDATKFLYECNSWPYTAPYTPYDKYNFGGGSENATDGHTFYGNVFGGGSGYFPYAAGKWHWEAGAVRGNTNVNITGGHILTNVYGGNELTNVGKGVSDTGHGKCTITMSNGTVGVPRTLSQIADHPVTCYIFGGGKGDPRVLFNKQTNVNDVEIKITGGIIYGSIFGGGEDGHVMRNVTMTIGNTDGSGPTIGTWGTSYVDGNVFGGGRGFSGDAYTAGNVAGSIDLKIKGGTMLGSIYGGGRLGSVGYGLYESTETAGNDKYGEMQEDGYGDYYLKNGEYTRDAISGFKRGHVEIEISGGTIGNTYEYEYNPSSTDNMPYTTYEDAVINNNSTIKKLVHTKGGNVFAGGMGRRMQLDGVTPITAVDWWRLGAVKSTKLTISGDAIIKSNVYGGCEFGEVLGYHTTNEKNWGTEIVITGGTIGTPIGTGETAYDFGAVYGGGMGEVYVPTSGENSGAMDKKIGGDVKYNTSVSMSAGAVKGSVYGGGELGSVGTVTNDLEEKDTNGKYKYKHIYSDATSGSEAENLANAKTFYDFGLGWPYEFIYNSATGLASVNITGSAQVSNYVFGGGKGKIDIRGSQTDNIVTHRYDEALIANVRETQVTIGTTGSPSVRTVYGGGEDGHVYENASVTIHNGTIKRSVFGGGKGEGTYKATLWEPKSGATDDVNQHQEKSSAEAVHSWTAGKVYGNTSVTMNDGSVGWFIYGGGNKASVGKGSYAGGSDDYSTTGYGELPPSANQALWTNADYTGSGQSTVTILGGTVGPTSGSSIDDDGIPHGSVFGGCRGIAAKDVGARSPRYRYVPDFFLGYVNKAIVNIGGTSTTNLGAGPTVHGSVYGGGQDGHVRNSTEVRIFKGTIAGQSDAAARSGHVFGAGSGIGTYTENNVAKCSYSSGSVTCTTLIEVYDDATINGNVYGGGAMAAVGPPRTVQPLDEQKTASGTTKSYSCTQVNIKGGTIKGHVFGASRGPSDDFIAWRFADGSYDPTKFATDLWSDVIISGGTIGTATTGGNVYGGGETGQVKCGVTVNITGGEIAKDVYGGGALAHTNTSVWKQNKTSNKWGWTDDTKKTAQYTTTVNLLGGIIHGDAYGGGLGRKEYGTSGQDGYVAPVEALVYGDVKVNLNGLESEDYVASIHGASGVAGRLEQMYGGYQVKDDVKGAIVNRVFGCNNLNGSPQGKVRVHVFATQNKNTSTIRTKVPLTFTEPETDQLAYWTSQATAIGLNSTTIIGNETNNDTKITLLKTAIETNRYDVQAVYGGANLAAYTPMGPNAHDATKEVDNKTVHYIDNDYKKTVQRSEVIIDGCHRTSIKQVYGGGNAAPVPASYLEVNGTYEIEESFGGGNGADNYTLKEGNQTVWYENPGANVGYENYTHKGTGSGLDSDNAIKAEENTDAATPELRKQNYSYGSGVATTSIKGGKIHVVYGGSNKKGNISTTALSMYESMNDDCPIDVDESYGGSKDAIIDGDIVTRSQCAHGVKEVFGGSKNADVNSDIVLTITNGSSYERVFGGNNTSGAVAGSITVNIEEGGCEPIKIKELYAGGYLAPYSIYGYETNGRGGYATEEIDYGGTIGKLNQCIPLTKEAFADVLVQYNTYKSHSLQVLGFANESEATEEAIAAKVAENPNDQDIANAAAQLVSINDFFRSYPKKDPRINIISATRIDNIYGGGYRALVVGSPHVNVNMTNGRVEVENKGTESVPVYNDADGNQYTDVSPETTYRATVNDTKIEVQRVEMTSDIESQLPTTDTGDYKVTEGGKTYVYRNGNRFYKVSTVTSAEKYWATLDIGTIGTIYGGGNMADIYGDTHVEIGTGKWISFWDENGDPVWENSPARNAATITGNVFGGGRGVADTFECEKAMVGQVDTKQGSTNVTIANGEVRGSVYGGGEIGRVEKDTEVTIGAAATDAPVIQGNVFGGGQGVATHGYSGLVRGDSKVTIQGKSQVQRSVYGGGEMATVGRFWVKGMPNAPEAPANTPEGMPYQRRSGGKCTVTVKDDAEIGTDDMKMLHLDAQGQVINGEDGQPLPPDDWGHVFGAGKGVIPYEFIDSEHQKPGRYYMDGSTYTFEEYGESNEDDYLQFIETLAIANETEVTIGDNAFVKGSVYGGSENGRVLADTHVTIKDDCQVGNGDGVNRRYTTDEWAYDGSTTEKSLAECASWPYGQKVTVGNETKKIYAVYDRLAQTTAGNEEKYEDNSSTRGGRRIASDGHTFFGNVYGGGSGLYPYKPGKWHRKAGSVGGNVVVDILGGHILTSVYGGNEHTDVGNYNKDANYDNEPLIPVAGTGKCTINMTGGTLGVPRTLEQIAAHPVTCYLFGAGKGDQRTFFNTWTNIREAEVNVTGGRIYGSVFGGGEDGHVIEDVNLNISGSAWIGTTGTSYVDGNVFGAGRGYSGDALTAGSVGGNVKVNISGGKMLGSVYGGGRLASVGTGFTAPDSPFYGQLQKDEADNPATTEEDETSTHGHVTINISGGTIGNNTEDITVDHQKGGNVFGGSMGRLTKLDGSNNPIWPKLAQVKTSRINIFGEALIKGNVYGGGELGMVRGDAYVTIGGILDSDNTTITSETLDNPTIKRDVFGGGYGSEDRTETEIIAGGFEQGEGSEGTKFTFTPMKLSGIVCGDTYINMKQGNVGRNIYGGGEMASVGLIDFANAVKHESVDDGFGLSWPYQLAFRTYDDSGESDAIGGTTHINITGGRLGNPTFTMDNGDVYGGGKGIAGDRYDYAFCANVKATNVTIDYPSDNVANPSNYKETNSDGSYKHECITGAVYGGGENGHVIEDTQVTLKNGLVGHSLYGGGSGKGTYDAQLGNWGYDSEGNVQLQEGTHPANIYSITAGKVYGNTNVTMSGGYVVRNVYGGGTLGSVGKGNYTGGANDYSKGGYGETIKGNLWNTDADGNVVTTSWQTPKGSGGNADFLGSGIATVTITGGTVGYIDPSDPMVTMKDNLPYGNVFGGCRGAAAPNVPTSLSPRYKYCPEFFMGYVNESMVTIGKSRADFTGDNAEADYEAYTGPVIWGSVYGGGQDGHVRRDTHVKILKGEIGVPFDQANTSLLGTNPDNDQWLYRGNVYGSGSGIGTYTDNSVVHHSSSSGSVTGHTLVETEGGTIYRNVYGGGSLSSIGPPPVGVNDAPYNDPCLYSRNQVNIKSKIGHDDSFTAGYGGHVFGASRGEISLGSSFASSLQTRVNIMNGAHILGNVFGGGDNGVVKKDAEVFIGEKKVENSEP